VAVLRFTILGCGSSPGVPRPNGDWGECDPTNPLNRRRRASLLVERVTQAGTTTIVIDTGPDFRDQMLDARVTRLDGVVYTHAHADHVHGIDDLRSFVLAQQTRIPVHADRRTLDRLKSAFDYVFETQPGSGYPPIVDSHQIETGRTFSISGPGGDVSFLPFGVRHGDMTIKGFRIGGLAYCTDASGFPEKTVPLLVGVDVLIIDALQRKSHPSHFSLGEALSWIERLQPKRAVLTHMHTPLDHAVVMAETHAHVEPAHDGMVIELAD
jgi:phosphoribosyl 1,2-cyclic phosphate phosphodiesterase